MKSLLVCIMGIILITLLSFWLYLKNYKTAEFDLSTVLITIHHDYKEKFLEEGFNSENLRFDNIYRINYIVWHFNLEPERGLLKIELINHGRRHVENAIKHFMTLNAVIVAEKNWIGSFK